MKSLGSVSNRNMRFLHKRIILVLDLWDGHTTGSLGDKVLFTALSEQILHMVELSLMLTIRLAYMLESIFLVSILKPCQVSLSSRWALAKASISETISGSRDISSEELLKTLKFQSLTTRSFSSISQAQAAT